MGLPHWGKIVVVDVVIVTLLIWSLVGEGARKTEDNKKKRGLKKARDCRTKIIIVEHMHDPQELCLDRKLIICASVVLHFSSSPGQYVQEFDSTSF